PPSRLAAPDAAAGGSPALPHIAGAGIARAGFAGRTGQSAWLPGSTGEPEVVVVGTGDGAGIATLGDLARQLSEGDYRLHTDLAPEHRRRVLLGWGLGAYRFERYRKEDREPARLLVPPDDAVVLDELDAVHWCRDLVNTPAGDMLPHDLEREARAFADACGAALEVTTGEALLERRLRVIHAVGRASVSAPRLIDLQWGDPGHPRVTLIGKGVCFDSGGLDLKTAAGMRLMKKDMGGAAHVLGLAKLVVSQRMPISLRVLVPAVENAVAGNAYRPGDVLQAYDDTTIEIDNTDAEGRLILCDAIGLARGEDPELIVDFATLTGAARVALGTELPAMFATDDAVADGIAAAGRRAEDPVWRMPLHAPYRRLLDSKVADLVNAPETPFGGAITAALFLAHFVGDIPWVHFDVMAWNQRARPAHPVGGEAMGLRAVYRYLEARYGTAGGT
ncbi:MAG: leucyl aminopeptidase family protein, partial [Gammaproteobacteria bacterium]|nr:leucyl aminopeptidase family protein [Gammaproteobacteria bacterium]